MFEDRVKKVSKVDLNLENILESVIHFLPNYLHKETFMRGVAFKKLLKNWLIVLNLSSWTEQQIQINESILKYLEGLKRQPSPKSFFK